MKKALFIALGLFMAMPQTFAKDLIVYLSRSHNTEAMAKMIRPLSKPRFCRKAMPMLESEKAPLPVGEGLG